MASFSDNVTKGIFPAVEEMFAHAEVTCSVDRLLQNARTLFDLPETSTLCIRVVRPETISDLEWESACHHVNDMVISKVSDGIRSLDVRWLAGTKIRHMVLCQDPLEESLLQESPKILNHLAKQLFTNFEYAEESYFEENGKEPPYVLKFMPADDIRKMPVIRMDLDRGQGLGVTGPGWNEAKVRLKTMADEFIREEGGVFDITVSAVRGIGFYYISLFQNED